MLEVQDYQDRNDGTVLVPLEVPNGRVYVSATPIDSHGEESEIGFRPPSMDDVLNALTGLARQMGARLQDTNASKVTVEFGCEFGIEGGAVVAVLGKRRESPRSRMGSSGAGRTSCRSSR